jgi:cell division protein FtsQ
MQMWNNPRLLNMTANSLFALALVLLAYAAIRVLSTSQVLPLRGIYVQGDLQHVARGDVLKALQDRVTGTFLTVDLDAIRALFESVAWVRRAEVRRVWPDRLEVTIEEHVALARWGQPRESRLVNTHGELFAAKSDAQLPLFSGPAGSEGEITRHFALFRQSLAPLGLEPREVLVSSRFAWQLKLSDGLKVQLGRDSEKDRIEDRLAKFVSVYPQTLGKLPRHVDYVDLRYPNGFALRVPDNSAPEPRKSARKRV